MLRLSWTAALLALALSGTGGRADELEFAGNKGDCSLGFDGYLFSRLKQYGYVHVGPYEIWARRVKGREALDVTFRGLDIEGRSDRIVKAERMKLRFWQADGILWICPEEGMVQLNDRTTLFFRGRVWILSVPDRPPDGRGSSRTSRRP